jgi:hypothetical protein
METNNEKHKDISKHIDLLDEDKAIAGQKFVCVSFVSPEKIIENKNIFYFEQFLNNWDMYKSMEKYSQFLNFICYKYNLKYEDVTGDLKEFVTEESDELKKYSSLLDDYKNFMDKHEDDVEKKFQSKNLYQTTVRGLKIRGSFPTMEEAELRCKILREHDPNHDVFVGPVGMWMPWDPEAYKTGRVEYLEEELNKLMHEKNKNEEIAKNTFEERVKESKMKAISDNIEVAKESGNKLTQNIDEKGNLIGIQGMNTQEESLHKNDGISVNDIKKELFEGDNIVMEKKKN